MGALGLPQLLHAQEAGRASRNKSVVWLWLGGGATHVETFDPKPEAPEEFRSVTGAINTNVPGIQVGGNWRRLAGVADKLAIVRSFTHRNAGHSGGTHWLMTGYDNQMVDNGGSPTRPGLGAILARHRGATTQNGLPTYVKTSGILGDGPSFLGASYAPFDMNGEASRNLNMSVAENTARDRRSLLRAFDGFRADADRSGVANAMDDFERQAFGLLTGNAREAFDIFREPEHIRRAYGDPTIGRQLLMARRLVEAGVGFVTIHHGGWDMHSNIFDQMNNHVWPIDRAIAAFIEDIHQRGLENDVLLVITGEFGRTPRINADSGRDHWPGLSTLALSGGGLREGLIVGESTSKAEAPRSRPVTPQDLMATVFNVLGMPQDLHYNDHTGRPTPMISDGRPIGELVV